MKIQFTQFALNRHWSKTFKGTRVTRMTPEELLDSWGTFDYPLRNGYADFCKIASLPNTPECRVGTLPISLENYQYLRSGYSARRNGELAVLSRWFELPVPAPIANYLIVVLYSTEQLMKEWEAEKERILNGTGQSQKPDESCDYGIVALMAQMTSKIDPIPPITMMRNALGIEEGGSGVPINHEEYSKSVEFWNTHATVR